MKKLSVMMASIVIAISTGCVNLEPMQPLVKDYDLGVAPLPESTGPLEGTGFFLNPVRMTEAIDSTDMIYRLLYDDPDRISSYTGSRWRVSPGQLLTVRVGQAMGAPIRGRSAHSTLGSCSIDIVVSAFEQRFSSPGSGEAVVDWTVSVADLHKRENLGKKRIVKSVPLATADARGGVAALSKGVDAAAADTIDWIVGDVLARHPLCGQKNGSRFNP